MATEDEPALTGPHEVKDALDAARAHSTDRRKTPSVTMITLHFHAPVILGSGTSIEALLPYLERSMPNAKR